MQHSKEYDSLLTTEYNICKIHHGYICLHQTLTNKYKKSNVLTLCACVGSENRFFHLPKFSAILSKNFTEDLRLNELWHNVHERVYLGASPEELNHALSFP